MNKASKTKSRKKNQHSKRKTKKLVPLNCSAQYNEHKYTCYDSETLHKLKNYWNARHPDHSLKSNDPREIWEFLKGQMSNICTDEACWLRQKFINQKTTNHLLSYIFAPQMPEEWKNNPTEWLTSLDIEKVMKQYELKHPNFAFIGPSPIDFDHRKTYGECVWSELCNFNLQKYIKKGVNKIGIVFNTDPHYKEGSHWISLFIDITKGKIYFFDSNGDKIVPEIKKLVERITTQGMKLNIKMQFDENYPQEHQYKNTECGIYSIYFLVSLLENAKTFNYFKHHRIGDKEMLKLREKYFNKVNLRK
jgi:hypothetical protein